MNLFNRLFKPQPTKPSTPPQTAPSNARKMCTKCKEKLPFDGFYRKAQSSDGLQHWCKKCTVQSKLAAAPKKRKVRKFVLKNPINNFQKKYLQLNIPNVTQDQYRQLVELAKARRCTMTRLYSQMLNDFLTLHSK